MSQGTGRRSGISRSSACAGRARASGGLSGSAPRPDFALSSGAISEGCPRVNRITGPLAFIVTGVVLGCLLGEIGIRIVAPLPVEDMLPLPYNHDGLRRLKQADTYLRFDPSLGWTTGPAARVEDKGVVYRSNAAGIRAEREVPPEPPAGVRRLAAFGDSFTHCDDVNYADCWTHELEGAWPGSEVLNFGVPAYGPDQAWLRYQRDGRPYRPCAVLIGYYVGDIERVVNRFRPFYTPETSLMAPKPRFLADGDGLTLLPSPVTSLDQLDDAAWAERALGPHDAYYYPGVFAGSVYDASHLVRLARTAAYRRERRLLLDNDDKNAHAPPYRSEGEAYQVAGRVLIEFARDVERDGATPVVVVFGGKAELASVRDRDRFYDPLLKWLEREGVPSIDTTDAVLREGRQAGVNPISLVNENSHYLGPANQAAARLLARELPQLTAGTCRGG
jgi:hypothetical protein